MLQTLCDVSVLWNSLPEDMRLTELFQVESQKASLIAVFMNALYCIGAYNKTTERSFTSEFRVYKTLLVVLLLSIP